MCNSAIINLIRSGLRLDKLASVTTIGAPPLIGTHSNLVVLMNDELKEDISTEQFVVISVHHIYQENLCKSSFKYKHVMIDVVRVVNLEKARGLKHKQFRSFLEDIETDVTDVF